MIRIFVKNLEFIGRHGVYEEERRDGRRFQVDLSAELNASLAAQDDDLAATVDYRHLAEIVLAVGTEESYQLVERMGHEILKRLFLGFPQVARAELTIRKFASDIPGDPECVGIHMEHTWDSI